MEIDFVTIGLQLQKLREKKGMSQEQVAEISGISTVHVGNIENARKEMGLKPFLSYCHAIGVTPNEVLYSQMEITDETLLQALADKISLLSTQSQEKVLRIMESIIDEFKTDGSE